MDITGSALAFAAEIATSTVVARPLVAMTHQRWDAQGTLSYIPE